MNKSSEAYYMSLIQQAMAKLDGLQAERDAVQAELNALKGAKNRPIAIIGIGCRFAGGADDPASFWQLLKNGVDAITEVPSERWDIDAYYDPDPDALGKMSTRYGGFLSGVDQFEPKFFGISPREAVSMDPQQRLLLEVSWQALENANLVPERLFSTPTGVFFGISTNDYGKLLLEAPSSSGIDAYFGTGNALSVASGRLSYLLGLTGPSMVVDTACSSSLVAIHLAVASLRNGECELALAGGVNLLLTPELTINFSKAHMMAPDGRCKTFDAAANGYVRGEGCGVIVLKRLEDALRDEDNILALIRGSAVNQDGPSGGLTVPNGLSQQAVIGQALQNSELEAADVSYIEAHGTGTALGDPIEVEGLGNLFGQKRQRPLIMGSVKTNIGHLEAAAGIAGLIKVVLSLQYEEIPPHLHFSTPNPHISWNESLTVPTKGMPWPRSQQATEAKEGQGKRIAGVSSFGFSGTNAHIVLEEAPPLISRPPATGDARPLHLLTLSAQSDAALQQLAQNYHAFLAEHPQLSLPDLCFTANSSRSDFKHRLAIIAQSRQQLSEQLGALTLGTEDNGLIRGQVVKANRPKIAFLFTGQGSQYVGMGRELYQTQPTFRQAIDRCDQILRGNRDAIAGGNREGLPLLSVLYPEPGTTSPLDQTVYTQPALFALEYALAELWQSWGITPDVVMGHSVGEIVAACVAGVFSLEDGLKLIAERARLMEESERGEMVAAFAAEEVCLAAIQADSGQVSLAAINGPENTVISGQRQAVKRVVERLHQQGVKTTRLKVSHAFHSPLMDPILDSFERVAREISYSTPKIKVISNLTGQLVSQELTTAEYWVRHIRQPVRFADGVRTLQQQKMQLFLEIGPKPTLLAMARRCAEGLNGEDNGEDKGSSVTWLPSLRQERDDWSQMLHSLGQLYVQGVSVEWSGFEQDYATQRRRLTGLPTYPWQRKRYWLEGSVTETHLTRQPTWSSTDQSSIHPLLGQRLPELAHLAGHHVWQIELKPENLPYLNDHRIQGTLVVPGVVYVEMALAAANEVFGGKSYLLNEIEYQNVLVLPEEMTRTVQISLSGNKEEQMTFHIHSRLTKQAAGSWTLHATGRVVAA